MAKRKRGPAVLTIVNEGPRVRCGLLSVAPGTATFDKQALQELDRATVAALGACKTITCTGIDEALKAVPETQARPAGGLPKPPIVKRQPRGEAAKAAEESARVERAVKQGRDPGLKVVPPVDKK